MSDPQYNTVDANSLESAGKGKGMTTQKKTNPNAWMDDGDDAHWVPVKPKSNKKKIATTDSIKSRPAQKGEALKKKMSEKKKITTQK